MKQNNWKLIANTTGIAFIKDSARLSELLKDSESLEKFAREQYLMKRDNEEIFIIMDK